LPTSSEEKKVVVNGKEEAPKKKTTLPLDVDWQAIVREKQKPKTEGG
jgi:hypothetical protein